MKKTNSRSGNTNTVRLGLRSSRNLLLPGEKLKDFKTLLLSYVDQFRPATAAEHEAVARMVGLRWKLHRADEHEDALLRAELQRLVNESPEKGTVDLIRRSLTMLRGLISMVPTFANASPVDAQGPLMNGVHTAVSMVDAVSVKVDLPVGVLADLVAAHEQLRISLIFESSSPTKTEDEEYRQSLELLRLAAEQAAAALGSSEKSAAAALKRKTEDLRLGVRLSISTVRSVDRYRAALERSAQREVDLLVALRGARLHGKASFGCDSPASFPAVELKLVQ